MRHDEHFLTEVTAVLETMREVAATRRMLAMDCPKIGARLEFMPAHEDDGGGVSMVQCYAIAQAQTEAAQQRLHPRLIIGDLLEPSLVRLLGRQVAGDVEAERVFVELAATRQS